MQNPRLASRYAKSLLDLAIEQKQLDATLADVNQINAVCQQSREFTNMLRSPIITADKKKAVINAVFSNNLSALSKAFINLITDKGRESALPEIVEAFIKQYRELKNIRTVRLITAAPVNDSFKESIRTKILGSLQEATIEIKEEINPDLIGGFVLEMDDKLFDASIRRDLNDVRKQFMKNFYISGLK